MEIQNNNIPTQSQDMSLSLGVKIILVLGGIVAAISAIGFVVMIGSEGMMFFFGIIYVAISLFLSYAQKAELRFALVIPLYIAGISLIAGGTSIIWHMNNSSIWFLISVLAIPALILTQDMIQRHLTIAQLCWFFAIGVLACEVPFSIVFLLTSISLGAYSLTVCAENQIRQNKYFAPELRTIRIVLLMLAMGLLIWSDFAIYEHSNGILSVVIALIMLPLTFWASDRAGLALSILFLIYALFLFYYNMEVDLLNKSLLLMVCGVVMIASFFIIKKQIK